MLDNTLIEFILDAISMTTKKALGIYIETYGNFTMGKFLLNIISIIKTKILKIMIFQIFNASQLPIIVDGTGKKTGKIRIL
jgi:hypothetical protein